MKINLIIDTDANVLADSHALHRCIFHIISNSIKFSPENGEINISVRVENGMVYISINDEGPGISPYLQSQAGNPFIRANHPMTSAAEGIGLGLAITKRLIMQMKGDLKIENEEGQGCTVSLVLEKYDA